MSALTWSRVVLYALACCRGHVRHRRRRSNVSELGLSSALSLHGPGGPPGSKDDGSTLAPRTWPGTHPAQRSGLDWTIPANGKKYLRDWRYSITLVVIASSFYSNVLCNNVIAYFLKFYYKRNPTNKYCILLIHIKFLCSALADSILHGNY